MNEELPITTVARLDAALKKTLASATEDQVRFLVDSYYQTQEARLRCEGQIRSVEQGADDPVEPGMLQWFLKQHEVLEGQLRLALQHYAKSRPEGVWMMSQKGIGPVISAGMLAHIDIERAPTAGHVWAFAGLDPTKTWEKGKKRPWNARLKVLCWKAGECFVKVSGKADAYYGQVYAQRKEYETSKNEAGDYAETALQRASTVGKTTEAYKHYCQGKLPPGHLHARAKRYAVKLFLAHLHEVMWRERYGTEPPVPYPIAHLGHAHRKAVPA